ncbi:MAG: hypothetical protein IPI67_07065 [Myxococcales bacterium]|nr:hypothetical protein [Myxococcales bacterium]
MDAVIKSSLLFAGLALVFAAPSARALSQSKHRSLSDSACRAQKLPTEFCDQVGAAAYNVDHYEWEDLSAHAQPEVGESKCQAANGTMLRIQGLAQELRTLAATQTQYDPALAVALGRALHTLQDNCAHSGMPNNEHAWFSLSDSCLDTTLSPDVQDAALACAKEQTSLAFQTFKQNIKVLEPPQPDNDPPNNNQNPGYWPPRGGVCDFLKGAPDWDGVDRRWNNAVVVPALLDQFVTTIAIDPAAPAKDVCAGGEGSLEPTQMTSAVDTSSPTEWCTHIKLYCAGKADGTDEAPPWEDATAPSSSASDSSGGCSTQGQGPDSPATLGLLAAAFALLSARRRRR